MRMTPAPAADSPIRVKVRVDAGLYLEHVRAVVDVFDELGDPGPCGTCEHARENHTRTVAGGPCSLCDCPGFARA
jgi:hypothetical protein